MIGDAVARKRRLDLAHERRDLVARRDLRRADEEGVGEARLVGHGVREHEAGEDTPVNKLAMDRAAFGTRSANSLR